MSPVSKLVPYPVFAGRHEDVVKFQLALGGLAGKGGAVGPQPFDVAAGQLDGSLADVNAH